MKTITVRISKDGSVSIHTEGYSGQECQNATRELEQALGIKVSEEKTKEYYQRKTSQQVRRTTGG